MKIAAVFGSPRQGANSETIAEAFLAEAQRLGATTERFHLHKMDYQGCIACMACKTTGEKCGLHDDLSAALDAVSKADIVLLATPVYFLDMPSQMKAFIDRWFSFFKPDYFRRKDLSRLAAGKSIVFVVTQGAPEASFPDFVQRYDFIFRMFGFAPMYLVRGCAMGPSPQAAAKRDDLLEKARDVARRVTAGEPSQDAIPPYANAGIR
jgi:multimeric flavodoxin WrbA